MVRRSSISGRMYSAVVGDWWTCRSELMWTVCSITSWRGHVSPKLDRWATGTNEYCGDVRRRPLYGCSHQATIKTAVYNQDWKHAGGTGSALRHAANEDRLKTEWCSPAICWGVYVGGVWFVCRSVSHYLGNYAGDRNYTSATNWWQYSQFLHRVGCLG